MSFVRSLSAQDAPVTVKSFYENGDPGPLTGTMAHVPEMLLTAMPFIDGMFGPSGLDFRTKEIVVLRTSAIHRCRYCVETHTAVAMGADLTREQLQSLRLESERDGAFSEPKDVVLLRWVDAVANSGEVISDELRAEMTEHFEDYEVVEITMLVGATMMLNRYATALQLPTSAATIARLQENHWLS